MKKIINTFFFLTFYVLAITLIENQGSNFLVEIAGDVFGASCLMIMGSLWYSNIVDEE